MTRRIDAHHHLWVARSGHHPMIAGPPVARFWGRSDELPRDYGIETYLADARAAGVVASVYVEAGYAPPEDEAAAIQAIADDHGFPQAFLTRIDLAAPDAGQRIARDALHPNWRGIRVMAPDPGRETPATPSRFCDPEWQRGLATLSAAGGVADLMVWPAQLTQTATLARTMPDATIVVEHCGLANGDPAWERGMELLADRPNVAVKLSGPGLIRRDWSAATLRPIVARLVALFGGERLMWGSNAPVDLVMADYPTIVARFDAVLAHYRAATVQAIWHDTAARLYRIGSPA